MRLYKYFGNGQVEVGDTVIKKFGQEYKLSDDDARGLLAGHLGIIPSDKFDGLFTREEISDRRRRVPANEGYMERHKRALVIGDQFLGEVLNAKGE